MDHSWLQNEVLVRILNQDLHVSSPLQHVFQVSYANF